MSNYYLSKCCNAQVTELDIEKEVGRCSHCKEMSDIYAELDGELDEIQEDTTSMEEKMEALERLHNDPKADILSDMIN